jgi:hypothetical protein
MTYLSLATHNETFHTVRRHIPRSNAVFRLFIDKGHENFGKRFAELGLTYIGKDSPNFNQHTGLPANDLMDFNATNRFSWLLSFQ